MKAFFSRLHIGSGAKERDKDLPVVQKEKFPPLRTWPPPDGQAQRVTSTTTSTSYASFKPLPELVPAQFSTQLTTRPLPSIDEPDPPRPDSQAASSTPTPPYSSPPTPRADDLVPELVARTASPRQDPDSNGRSSRKTTNGSVTTATTNDVQKKVAFISPAPTPANMDRTVLDPPGNGASPSAPMKTTLSRFQAAHGKEPRGSTSSSGASSSKTDLGSTPKAGNKATSTRTASPYLQKPEASAQSLRSGTPYSSMSQNTSGSRILAAQSWSEVTEEDLVSNLGSRERTRQEVLFEIISSEERLDSYHAFSKFKH